MIFGIRDSSRLKDRKLYLGSFSGLTGSTGSTGAIGAGLTGVTGVFDHNSYLGLDCSAGTPFFGDLGISVMSGRGYYGFLKL